MSDEADKSLNALHDLFERYVEQPDEFKGESDRAAAILAASNFEVWLGEVIKVRFGVLSGEMSSDLLRTTERRKPARQRLR